jgi:hypothetical protein
MAAEGKGAKRSAASAEPERDGLAEGVEHLQAAAKEVIRATRSLLDAAEGLVEDPAALQGLLGTLGSLASAAAGRLKADLGGAAGGRDDDGRVHHIDLS